ncbi:F0F1 ATP synthase subunit B [Clostridium sp.]|uniref:F0F1 ATP synthase subunit B n=1 Tax=Clostridium sp. TaxID=1506 RepID=UPI0025C0CE1D|nr:F0F1 ATP synthase subunit B [Clostridium sp.]MCI9303667.1 F0F1 ATP synthase subunit B [Clostridium sp.]
MEFNLGVILATVVNFLILFFGLKYFFFEKVKLVVEARENEISQKLDSADEEFEKARTLAINNERELQRAREEGKAITERHKKKAEKVYDEIVGEAKSEANLIVERAKIEIEREKEKAEYALKKEAIDLALDLSRKVIEKNIDEEKNRQLIDEFISEVGN